MKSEMFQKAISNIDDKLIEAADVKAVKRKGNGFIRWASVAAAAYLVAVCAVVAFLKINNPIDHKHPAETGINTQTVIPTEKPGSSASPTTAGKETAEPIVDPAPPYEEALNIIVFSDRLLFQRIAVTPRIVISNQPIINMKRGKVFDHRHDIMITFFRAMDKKEVVTDIPDCDFSYYVYMFDNNHDDVPWHYCFAINDDGLVRITNNDELICCIRLSDEELMTVIDSLK